MTGRATRLAAVGLMLLAAAASAAAGGESSGEHFTLAWEPLGGGVSINRIHSWRLRVETAGGEPVTDALITVDGGMPAHDHGLPTAPRVTKNLGNGEYLLDGLRFHMNGEWTLRFLVQAAGHEDVIVVRLVL